MDINFFICKLEEMYQIIPKIPIFLTFPVNKLGNI